MKKLAMVLIFLLMIVCAGCGSPDDDTGVPAAGAPEPCEIAPRLIDIGGRSLALYAMGEGSPTIVIDTGLGDSGLNWCSIMKLLAEETRVCSYDRAGYGASDGGPLPRSPDTVIADLEALLERAGERPPYLLVGHSLGCVHAFLFAARRPDLVGGVCLLDPPPLPFIAGERFRNLRAMADDMTREFERLASESRGSDDPAEASRAVFFETLASEHEMMFRESSALMWETGFPPTMPLTVIGSDEPNPMFGDSAAVFQQFWVDESRKLSRRSSVGAFVLARGSGHNLYREAPDTVLRALRELLERIDETQESGAVP